MPTTNTVELICRLPVDYHSVGTKSLLHLIDESGYTNDSAAVTESSISSLLRDQPEWCDAWIGYSQDRRTSSGWTIQERNGNFVVQYYPNGSNVLTFTDKPTACAAFVMRELASLTSRGG